MTEQSSLSDQRDAGYANSTPPSGGALLIIFYRNPELGKVKTRLAATLGDEAALAIYFKLVSHTRAITENLLVDKIVYYSNYIDTEDSWSNSVYHKSLQTGNDLGEKMKNAFEEGFKKGHRSICIIGTDCYELTADIISQAFESLKSNDAVIGPAKDGGYYLLGMNSLHSKLFQNKKWSTPSVASETISDFESHKLNYKILTELRDVDTEEDLPIALMPSK